MKDQILWTASVTPFDSTGLKLDYASFEACLKRQEQAKNGVVLFGSTGEGLSLSLDERRELLSLAMGLKLNTPIMVGVPSHNLKEALSFMSFCREFPIASYLLTTPIYTKPGILGQTAWFETLLNEADKPVMIYNNPGRSAMKLHTETLKNLCHHKNWWALKDSDTLEAAQEHKIAAPNVALFGGDDYLMPSMALIGAEGLVSVIANAWPMASRRYVEHCLKAQKLNSSLWWQAGLALFSASNPIPIKALMKDIGLIAHDTVRLPLSQKDHQNREVLLKLHDSLADWSGHELC